MKFHDELNPVLWDKENDNQMRPEVIAKLQEIAEAFIEYLEIPQDAVLDKVVTGSSASYNYNEFSDLDLHIIVDYDKVHKDCPLVQGYLGALKNTFNKEHDITIHDVPVELYAEAKDQGTVHNGLYSVQEEEWIDRPKKIAPTDNDAAVEAKFNEIKELVDKCDDSEEATELLEKIYTMRKAGLAEAGEFCTENLAFKKLRNEGCMDKLRQIKKEQIDKQLSLESYNESNTNLKEQIKQLFPWIYSTTVYNIGEVFDDRGIINLNFEIEGGRSDNEIFIWVFQDNLEIWYTNGGMGGRSHVGSIKIDDITKDNFIASVMDLLKLAKSTIEEFYKKEEKRQKEEYSKTRTYDIEDDEKELYAFISKTLKSIKKQLNKEFSIHQTDNTIYINYDKKPENTVFVEPVKDSTQILKIGLLDDNNDEIDYRELDLEDFGKTDINNIINTIKELFMNKNESIKESKGYNENVDDIVVDNYLKMLLDNGHVVDTPDSQYVVQVFTNKKLQKLVEFDDIRKAAETFIEFTDIYTKDEDVVLFKQMRDNGKDIKTIDSTWLNVSNKNESIHKLNRTINKAIGEDTLGEKNYIIPCDTIEEAVNVIKVIWGQHFVDISNKYHPNKELIGGIYRMEKTTGDSEGSAYLLGYFDAQNKRLHVYTKVRHGEHMSGRPKNYDYLRNTLKPNYKELNNFTQKFKEAIGEDMEKEPVYHYSVEDIDKQGNDFDNAEEAYEQAQKDLTALGYEVKELNDDGEFEIVSTSTGVAYTGVIYPSNPELDESLEWEICRDMEAGYFYICNDEEIYCDPDGEPYHFDTREAAEEFLHSLNEDAATLEKKMDVAQDTLNDLLKSITDVREDFDLDKAYNLINEALKED